ncbi:MAG: fructose-bisphosphatase class II [Rhodoluna sp.]|nr:fructose-bisphosphatase class II [Rhodoluna sp.]MBP7819023.1 fructose-bisphosphatase class II [Rhodoluna sp.]
MPLTNAHQSTRDILAATVAAAAAAWPHVGSGDKLAVDGAAVDAMRASLSAAQFGGVVIIGEGEKDEAPMLFNGEVVGHPDVVALSIDWDIAVDPVDGTRLAAEGIPGAVAVMAAAERGAMLESSEVYMMKKIVSGPAGRGVLDIDATPAENIAALAEVLGKPVHEVRVAVINKARNFELIAQVQDTGAEWVRFDEGDIAMAVAAATPGSGVDLLLGVGGSPEGVVAAVAVQVLGGFMQTRFAPQDSEQIARGLAAGYDLEAKFELDDLVSGDRFVFVLTGITDGVLARGVLQSEAGFEMETFILDSALPEPVVITHLLPAA